MCQPGPTPPGRRPRPARPPWRVSTGRNRAGHACWDRLRRARRAQLIQRLAGELAVTGKLAHRVIDVAALRLVGQALALQRPDHVQHATYVLRGARLMIGFLHPEGGRVLVHVGDVARGQFAYGLAVFNGTANDLVVDVGDIAHVGEFKSACAQPALHHVEYHHDARMAQVAVIVDGHAAYVHAHPARLDRDEILLATGKRVVYLQHARVAAW